MNEQTRNLGITWVNHANYEGVNEPELNDFYAFVDSVLTENSQLEFTDVESLLLFSNHRGWTDGMKEVFAQRWYERYEHIKGFYNWKRNNLDRQPSAYGEVSIQ